MKYVILIYSNPASREAWVGFADRVIEHAARVPEATLGLVEV